MHGRLDSLIGSMLDMKNWRHGMLLLAGALACGCGTIIEVPIVGTTTEMSEGESGDTTGTTASTVDGTMGGGTEPDVDDAPSSGEPEATTSEDTSGGTTEQVSTCAAPALVIPDDGTWIEIPVELPAQDDVLGLGVAVRITHERVSHLRVRLRAPDDSFVTLLDTPSCQGPNVDATFEDAAAQSAEASCDTMGTSAIVGSVMPLDALAPLLETPVEGTWMLELSDATPDQQGSIDQLCLILTVEAG